jgi:hypothetical protein
MDAVSKAPAVRSGAPALRAASRTTIPTQLALMLSEGDAHLARGQDRKALAIYERAAGLWPSSAVPGMRIARLLEYRECMRRRQQTRSADCATLLR